MAFHWPLLASLLLLAAVSALAVRRYRRVQALRRRGRSVTATLALVNYATGAAGVRTRMATWEFKAADPVSGALKTYRGSGPFGSGDILDPTEGEPVNIRYLPEDPSVSGLPSARPLDANLLIGVIGFGILSVIALFEALEKTP
jgi:hypothetical protein